MTESAINPNINERYPYPGVDNSLQGFRDNFTSIKSNLVIAKEEITDLLNHVARHDDQPINLNGHLLTNTVLKNSSDHRYTVPGLQTSNFDIDYNNGNYQSAQIGSNLTINFKNFPVDDALSSKVGTIRLKLFADTTTRKVEFTATNAVLKYNIGFPFVDATKLSIPGSSEHNPVILDIWQVGSGYQLSTVLIKCEGVFLHHQ